MRADMIKVLTERPRAGSHKCYREVRAAETRHDYDDLPTHQGMRRPYKDDDNYKQFSDLLGPLQRFFRSCVGRRYDDVWSEVCASLPADTTQGNHLRDHARRECETNTTVIDGKVVECGRRFYRVFSEPYGLYVDPRDGLIYHNDNRRQSRPQPVMVDGLAYRRHANGILYPYDGWSRRNRTALYPLKLINGQRAMFINGIWYWIIMAETPAPVSVPYEIDGVIRYRTVYSPRYDFIRGEDVQTGWYYAWKRQMASRDLRRNGLAND